MGFRVFATALDQSNRRSALAWTHDLRHPYKECTAVEITARHYSIRAGLKRDPGVCMKQTRRKKEEEAQPEY